MAAGLHERTIDDRGTNHVYEFEKWGADESLSNLLKISKLAGKPLGLLVGAFVGGEEKGMFDKNINPDLLAMAMEALTQNMDEALCISLIKKLSSANVLCDGGKINFNTHYADRLDHLFKVVYAALEVQYGNFFGALLGVVQSKRQHPMVNKEARM